VKIHLLSLGCARALVDSEGLGGLLAEAGHTLTDCPDNADCTVVNTCAFIREAEEESVSEVLALAERKRSGSLKRLYVVGCLPQKHRQEEGELIHLLPEVDGFLGTGDLPKLPQLIAQDPPDKTGDSSSARFFKASPASTLLFNAKTPRHPLTPKHYAFLKISEGCDHTCAFCSIPQYRGPHRSRSIKDLVAAAHKLADQGVVELNLIGQDSSAYGLDHTGRLMLPELLEELSTVDGIRWIRILYAHPVHVTDELIAAIRDLPKVTPYIDVPLQHISDPILKAMRRQTSSQWIHSLIERLRRQVPGIAIRSSFIVGFPGETEAQVEELAQFLRTARLERVGIFPYRAEPKTLAERMPHPVKAEGIQARLDRLMTLQREIAEEIHQGWVGRTLEVLIDRKKSEPNLYQARSYADAPEVDGEVFITAKEPLAVGRFLNVKITDAVEYDLMAEPIESFGVKSTC